MKRLHEVDAYLTGELPDGAAADAFEEALFDAPDDPEVTFLDRLARHGRQLADHHTFYCGLSRAQLDDLIAAGHEVQLLTVSMPGSTTSVTISPTVELFATQLMVPEQGLRYVDVEVAMIDHGGATKTIKDVVVDSDGSLYGLCERPLAMIAYGSGRVTARVRRRDGAKDVLAEYHFVPAVM